MLASPVKHATGAFRCASCTPIAAGSPKPMVPRPPELIQRRGLLNSQNCAAHTDWGLMILLLRSYFRQSFRRHCSICFHHVLNTP